MIMQSSLMCKQKRGPHTITQLSTLLPGILLAVPPNSRDECDDRESAATAHKVAYLPAILTSWFGECT
jgi:hypothetical protein